MLVLPMIQVTTPSGDKLSLHKEYGHFKALHDDLSRRYSAVSSLSTMSCNCTCLHVSVPLFQLSTLNFPPTKWFGSKRPEFVEKRRQDLQVR